MKLTALETKLIAAARAGVPSEQVPYCFEKRIMARLADAAPLSVAVIAGGVGYSAAPVVTFTGGGATTQATGTVQVSGTVTGVTEDGTTVQL